METTHFSEKEIEYIMAYCNGGAMKDIGPSEYNPSFYTYLEFIIDKYLTFYFGD